MALTEEEYFKIASGNQALNQTKSPVKQKTVSETDINAPQTSNETQTLKKRGRKPKTETPKPVYNIGRDNTGQVTIEARQQNINTNKTINQINEEILNNSIDDKTRIKQKMLEELREELTRIQIEIDIKKTMYDLYNKDIYNKQITQYKDRYNEVINKIRILQNLYLDK